MSSATVRLRSSDGTPIALHPLGGEGPPLVICHATGFHGRCYLPMAATLARGFAVWAIDFRGHGGSRLDPGVTFTWADFVEDLSAAIDHLGGSVHALGHSMGGGTILSTAAVRPDAIRAAWVYEPIILPDEVEPRGSLMGAAAAKRRPVFESRAEALARYASRPPFGLVRADALWSYVEYGFVDRPEGDVELACRPEHEALTFDGATTRLSSVAGLELPVRVVRGRVVEGEPSAALFADPLAASLPNGELVELGDLGHLGAFEAPDQLAADALEFLTGF